MRGAAAAAPTAAPAAASFTCAWDHSEMNPGAILSASGGDAPDEQEGTTTAAPAEARAVRCLVEAAIYADETAKIDADGAAVGSRRRWRRGRPRRLQGPAALTGRSAIHRLHGWKRPRPPRRRSVVGRRWPGGKLRDFGNTTGPTATRAATSKSGTCQLCARGRSRTLAARSPQRPEGHVTSASVRDELRDRRGLDGQRRPDGVRRAPRRQPRHRSTARLAVWCYDGEFVNNTNATSRQPCPPGRSGATGGRESRRRTTRPVRSGHVRRRAECIALHACAVGRFQNLSGALGCDACDEGMVATGRGKRRVPHVRAGQHLEGRRHRVSAV